MAVVRVLSILVVLAASCLADNYVPGNPGAEWTQEEVDILKEKLVQAWKKVGDAHTESAEYLYDPYGNVKSNFAWYPQATKTLRLAFHDCLKYTDGTGGCDGCLNFDDVGTNIATDNNGLQGIAAMLENVYRNPTFPAKGPAMETSFFELGKSRADLWALAGAISVDYFAQKTNEDCAEGSESQNCDVRVNNDSSHCNADITALKFQSGRADCVTDSPSPYGFATTKAEAHPNPNGNGEQTTQFYKDNFDFSMKEAVAIMGAHTIGKFNNAVSGFLYSWVRETTDLLNNEYYKLITARPEYALHACIGDEYRNKANASWKVLAEGKNKPTYNGRIIWFHQFNRCPDCIEMSSFDESKFSGKGGLDYCCSDLDDGLQCKPECVKSVQKDQTAMNCEMGFYYKFGIEAEPPYKTTGCPGYDNWRFSGMTTPECPLQDLLTEEGNPLHTVVEEYADDQQHWVDDFLAAFARMQANGCDNLVDGPNVVTA